MAANRNSSRRKLRNCWVSYGVFEGGKPDCCSTGGGLLKSPTARTFCRPGRDRFPSPLFSAVSKRKTLPIGGRGGRGSPQARAAAPQVPRCFFRADGQTEK